MHRPPLVAFALLVAACAARPAPPPAFPLASPPSAPPEKNDYVAVHIDTVAPAHFAQFVDARHEWLATLREHHATDGRGVFLQVGDGAFYTVRHFAAFGDFDTRGDAIDKSLAAVPKEAGDRYDRLADASLVYPHTSEIWARETDLAYAPVSAAGAIDERSAWGGRLVVEDVRADPASEKAYSDATTAIDVALGEAHYPLTRVTYRTVFGAGHVFTLWLAPSRDAFDAAPSVTDAVSQVRGPARAAELVAAIDGAVAHRETAAVVVRHDMTQ